MIKKIQRFIHGALLWLCVTTPLEIIGLLVLAVVLLFTKKDAVQLPSIFGLKLFKIWDNYESYVMDHNDPDLDGLAGPDYYIKGNYIDLDSYWSRYLARLNWLGIRNPLNYFQYTVLGVKCEPGDIVVTINTEYGTESESTSGAYEYYYVIPYSFWKGKGLRVRIGWKITSKWKPIQQFAFVFNPFYTI